MKQDKDLNQSGEVGDLSLGRECTEASNGCGQQPTPELKADWTKEKPTQDGWYWYRHNPDKYVDLPPEVAAPLMLMVYDNASRVQDTVNDLFGRAITDSMDGLWAGPLVPPTFNAPEHDEDKSNGLRNNNR